MTVMTEGEIKALVKYLRNPWREADNVERGPLPAWEAALLFQAANCLEDTAQQLADAEARLAAAEAQVGALRAERRMIVSHATMGGTDGDGLSVNEISVRITALRNSLYQEAQADNAALRARLAEMEGKVGALREALVAMVDLFSADDVLRQGTHVRATLKLARAALASAQGVKP